MNITGKEFKKFEYLVGFVNNIVEMVTSPEEYLDPNTKDSSVTSIWYSQNKVGNLVLQCLCDGETVTEFRDNLKEIEDMVKERLNHDYTSEWEKLRS